MGLFFSSATVGAMHFQKMTQTKIQVTLIDTYLMEIEFNADMDYVCSSEILMDVICSSDENN